jgi:hypothetical protein
VEICSTRGREARLPHAARPAAGTVRPTASRVTVCAGTAVPTLASTAMPLKSQTGNAVEPNANSKPGPDPPDILRETAFGNPTGVELTGGPRLSKSKRGQIKLAWRAVTSRSSRGRLNRNPNTLGWLICPQNRHRVSGPRSSSNSEPSCFNC